jgi:hypothetical protein
VRPLPALLNRQPPPWPATGPGCCRCCRCCCCCLGAGGGMSGACGKGSARRCGGTAARACTAPAPVSPSASGWSAASSCEGGGSSCHTRRLLPRPVAAAAACPAACRCAVPGLREALSAALLPAGSVRGCFGCGCPACASATHGPCWCCGCCWWSCARLRLAALSLKRCGVVCWGRGGAHGATSGDHTAAAHTAQPPVCKR